MKNFKEIIEGGDFDEFNAYLEDHTPDEGEEIELMESGSAEQVRAYLKKCVWLRRGAEVALVKRRDLSLLEAYVGLDIENLCHEARELLDETY